MSCAFIKGTTQGTQTNKDGNYTIRVNQGQTLQFRLIGYGAQERTVGAEGTINMNSHTKDADQLLAAIAATMVHPPSNEYTHGGEPWLMIGPEHADILQRGGISKAELKRRLWEASKMRAGLMAVKDRQRVIDSRTVELGTITEDTLLPISVKPEEICIMVAGGPGTHSVYVPCFGNSFAATQEIRN